MVDNVDYLAVCGDLASAYASNPASLYWDNAGALMALADTYLESGFILKKNLFLFGNHEWWEFGGCMTDYEYRSSPESTSVPGGSLIKGKGLLAAVDGKTVSLKWYDVNDEVVEGSETITIG